VRSTFAQRLAIPLAALSLTAGFLPVVASPATAQSSCANGNVNVVFVRGSGEHLNDQRAHQFYMSLIGSADKPGALRKLGLNAIWTELGNEDGDVPVDMTDDPGYKDSPKPKPPNDPNEYPAVAAAWAVTMPPVYSSSVNTGITELITYLNQRSVQCPTETFAIGGYSQGAQVVGETMAKRYDGTNQGSGLTSSTKRQIGYMALYGDPKLYAGTLKDRVAKRTPWWVQGDDPGYRTINNKPMAPNNGILQARIPYVADDFKGKFGSWCAKGDGICAGLFPNGMSAHSNSYQGESGWISKSADKIATPTLAKVRELNPTPPPNPTPTPQPIGNVLWNHQFQGMRANNLSAYPGGVVASNCTNTGRAFEGLDGSGLPNNLGPSQTDAVAYTCSTTATGKDGTVYAERISHDPDNYIPATYRHDIVAYNGGSESWARELTSGSPNKWLSVQQLEIGADGNPYALLYGNNSNTVLASYNHSNGRSLFETTVDSTGYFLWPYRQGIILWPMYDGQARYFSYSGVQQLAFTPAIPSTAGRWAYTADGDVLVTSYQSNMVWQVTKFTTSGTVAWSHVLGSNSAMGDTYATPSGGVIVTWVSGSDQWMLALNASGQELWRRDLGHWAVGWQAATRIDTNGNIVFRRIYATSSGEAVEFSVISGATGQTSTHFTTEGITNLSQYRLSRITSADSRLYGAFTQLSCPAAGCSPDLVYAFAVPGLSASYPEDQLAGP
jgi:hypothetical protein